MKSYYEILGVSENASQENIRNRYRKLALEMHPDKLHGKPEDEVEKIQKNFQEITNAYQTLSDENKRRKYDSQRGSSSFFNSSGNGGGFGGFSNEQDWSFDDIFESFFNGGKESSSSERYQNSSSSKAEDIYVALKISFKDLIFSSTKQFELKLLRSCLFCNQTGAFSSEYIKNCNNCKGSGFVETIRRTILGSIKSRSECGNCGGFGKIITKKCNYCKGLKLTRTVEKIEVKIPRGIKPGQKITMKRRGNDGINQTRSDVVIEINLRDHNLFQRKNNDIHCSVPVSFIDAIVGNSIKVITFEGVKEIKMPRCSQVGDFYILKNKGFYTTLNGQSRGDFYVWFQIQLPKRVSPKTEEIFSNIYNDSSWNPNEDFVKRNKEIIEG